MERGALRQASIVFGAIEQIVNRSKANDVVKIGTVCEMSSGGTALAAA